MRRLLIIAILSTVVCGSTAIAADRIRIAYSSISGAYTGIWVAHDAGFFAKEGLEDQIILIPSANSTGAGHRRRRRRHLVFGRRTADRRRAQRRGLESIR